MLIKVKNRQRDGKSKRKAKRQEIWSINLVEITERERKTNYEEIPEEILTGNFPGLEKGVKIIDSKIP